MKKVKLGDLVTVMNEREDNPSQSKYDRFVGLEHYDSGSVSITRWGSTEMLVSAMKVFHRGDILVARRNVYLKRASSVDFDGITSGDSIILHVNDEQYKDIVPFVLNTDSFWDYADQHSDGSMSKRLAPKTMLEYEFTLPDDGEVERLSSETDHSLYVGSYGRNTAINTSDLDVMVILPEDEYDHFTSLNGNGPSKLLQAVKNAISNTYPNTSIHGDGQVVVIKFSDGMRFEILPAFQHMVGYGYYRHWDGTYIYPDSNMGGNWLSTNPKAEQDAMTDKNTSSNGLLVETCKHIRYIRDTEYSSYHLSGILVDAFVYEAIGGWHFRKENEQHVDSEESYEQALVKRYNDMSYGRLIEPMLKAPGSNMSIDSKKGWSVLGKVLDFMV